MERIKFVSRGSTVHRLCRHRSAMTHMTMIYGRKAVSKTLRLMMNVRSLFLFKNVKNLLKSLTSYSACLDGEWYASIGVEDGPKICTILNILALRRITDYARRKKKLLYVTFGDFSSAYDLIPRQLMLNVLRELGCGAVFLAAIAATYHTTQSLLGTVWCVYTRDCDYLWWNVYIICI